MITGHSDSYFIYMYIKDYLPHLFHGFRNKYSNKISFNHMLHFHN